MKYKKTYIVELQAEKKKFHITMDFLQDEKNLTLHFCLTVYSNLNLGSVRSSKIDRVLSFPLHFFS